MQQRGFGFILLVVLACGLIYSRSALAASPTGEQGAVSITVSPLALLTQGHVSVRLGDTACTFVPGEEPVSVCPDLPPGDYPVTATAEGYTVVPAQHILHVTADGASEFDFRFNFYRADHRLRMPVLSSKPLK